MKLTLLQRLALPSVLWLITPSPYDHSCGTGRTDLLAYAFLTWCKNHEGSWIQVWDHIPIYICKQRLIDRIASMRKEEPFISDPDFLLLSLEIKISTSSIRLVVK